VPTAPPPSVAPPVGRAMDLRLPWEHGMVGLVLGGGAGFGSGAPGGLSTPLSFDFTHIPCERPLRANDVLDEDIFPVRSSRVEVTSGTAEHLVSLSFQETRTARICRKPSSAKHPGSGTSEDARRDRVINSWLDLALLTGGCSSLMKRAFATHADEGIEWQRSVVDALQSRATNTLAKRANSLALYVRWCSVRYGDCTVAFPFEEPTVYRYLSQLREDCAPATRARSFLEAATLFSSILEIPGFDDVSGSFRVSGVSHASFRTKRLTRKARALTRSEVITFEVGVFEAACLCDRYFCGFVCWLIFSRTRFSDSAKISEPILVDVDATGLDAYGESTAHLTKTGGHGRRLRVPLPVVAPAAGITERSWLREWLSVGEALGLTSEHGLMPTPNGSGNGFTKKPLSTSEASVWMQELLTAGGHSPDSVADVRTHSCRATLLSWCAKYGVREGVRRLLGYHAKPADKAMLEYSRDALAAPLRQLGEVIEAVAQGSFLPDSTRSGYFPNPPAAKADSSQPESRKRDRSPSRASRSEAPLAYSPTVPGDSSSSDSFQSCEDSESNASPSDVDSEEASSRFPEVTGERGAPEDTSFLSRALPENGVFCHVLYGTWHLGSSDSGTLACGRRIFWGKKTHYNRMGAWPSDQRSWCKLCRGKLS
jgi:hypothetical protein